MRSSIQAFKSPRVLEKNPSLWGKEGVKPQGARQGALGDCWLIAAAASVAEYPERVKRMFVNQDFTDSGIFQMQLFYKGLKKTFNIDDRIGVTKWGNPFSTQKSRGDAWWMVILEKAMAKMNVNYLQLQAGNVGFGLRELTGMPTRVFKPKDYSEEDLWNMIE